MSALPDVYGHDEVRVALAHAVRERVLPAAILLHGRPGVGRQRIGLWLAQLLHCESPDGTGPCGRCRACRFSARLEHPDTHWFFPLARPRGATTPEKLADALEDARMAELAARREDPLRTPIPGEPLGLYLAQVRTLHKLAATRPAMGERKAFLIGNAELLVPQESSPEAANALLKLLEEPPTDTTIILTASQPDALLPTVRSRLLSVRLQPLAEPLVVHFLREHRSAKEPDARRAARLAQGAIGRALGFLPSGREPAPLEQIREHARALLVAAASPSAEPRYSAALRLTPTGARGTFRETLDLLVLWIRDLAATATGNDDHVLNHDAQAFLADLARRLPAAATAAPDAINAIQEARTLTANNVNPQLTAARLLRSIHDAFYQRGAE